MNEVDYKDLDLLRRYVGDRGKIEARRKASFTDRPLAVLVNRDTTGAAEVLAAILQRSRRATVLGERTRGQAALSLWPLPLADGSELRLAAVRNLFADGSPLPAWVSPDVAVPDDAASLADGRDALLESALSR